MYKVVFVMKKQNDIDFINSDYIADLKEKKHNKSLQERAYLKDNFPQKEKKSYRQFCG